MTQLDLFATAAREILAKSATPEEPPTPAPQGPPPVDVSAPKTRTLVSQIKNADQDFEWYPTTQNMIEMVYHHICQRAKQSSFSLLDIGAGDGRIFSAMEALSDPDDNFKASLSNRYAIEKSKLLIQTMPGDVCIVGTDFHSQTLIDKESDVIFCNPPYSEYEQWAARIIREANAKHLYLIIPNRWTCSKEIQSALDARQTQAKVISTSDFLNADRSARAKVDILYIALTVKRLSEYSYSGPTVDPFDLWFSEQFPVKVTDDNTDDKKKSKEDKQKEKIKTIIRGRDQVQILVELYDADIKTLIDNYKNVCVLDPDILQELGVSVKGLRDAFQQKIKGLKNLYWQEVFERLQTITTRLTTATREQMLKRLTTHSNVDFTAENIYAVVVWCLKNVNKYIDTQLLDVYMMISSEANTTNYKSNRHIEKDSWRYCRPSEFWDKHHHYSLEYRLVLEGYSAIFDGGFNSYDYSNNLSKDAHNKLGDIFAVAWNLGFNVTNDTHTRTWTAGAQESFYYMTTNGESKLFAEVRAFKNGNIHIKAKQEFIQALNVEAARLNGWIKGASDAAAEMNIPITRARKYYESNAQIKKVSLLAEPIVTQTA